MISLLCAATWTFLTLEANLSVDLDSSIAVVEGLIVQITATFAVPDKDGCKICVSFESRYGMCVLGLSSVRAATTFSSVSKLPIHHQVDSFIEDGTDLLLMKAPSTLRSC